MIDHKNCGDAKDRAVDSSQFQQALVSHAVKISKLYTGENATAYRTAAETLRVAYWDWAADATLPEAVTTQNVKVNSPGGPLTMSNPFRRYYFKNYPFTIKYMDAGVLSSQHHTTRCPNAKQVDNVAAVNRGLSGYGSLKDQVVRGCSIGFIGCLFFSPNTSEDI